MTSLRTTRWDDSSALHRFVEQRHDRISRAVPRLDEIWDRNAGGLQIGQRHPGRTRAYSLVSRRRPAFHTSPHAPHLQYVAAVTTLLTVVTEDERHVGQFDGTVGGATATLSVVSALWGYLIA